MCTPGICIQYCGSNTSNSFMEQHMYIWSSCCHRGFYPAVHDQWLVNVNKLWYEMVINICSRAILPSNVNNKSLRFKIIMYQ